MLKGKIILDYNLNPQTLGIRLLILISVKYNVVDFKVSGLNSYS